MTWVCVRHGETERNLLNVRMGCFISDEDALAKVGNIPDHHTPLTSWGGEQARQTGMVLREEFGEFDLIAHSGYDRIEATSDGLFEAYSPVTRERLRSRTIIDERLRERNSGYTFGMLKSEVDKFFPWFQQYWDTAGPFFARPIGGESICEVVDRVRPFVTWLHDRYGDKDVLLIVHGRTLTAIRYILEGWSYAEVEEVLRQPGARNCGVTVYEPDARCTFPRARLVYFDRVYRQETAATW